MYSVGGGNSFECSRGGGGMERAQGHTEPLLALQERSTELGRAALTGSRAHKRQQPASPLQLLQQLEELKKQKFALENKIRAGEIPIEDFPPESLTMEYMTEGIESLEEEIDKLKVANYNKSLVLRRLQLYSAIHNKLLEKNTESQLLFETMEHSVDLCPHILKSQKETRALEEKLIDVRKKRLELAETCTEVMTELRALKENENNNFAQMDNQSFRTVNAYIAKEIDTVTVIQNVFQRLILGSAVNWAEDPKLKETVLKLGQNPACF